MRFNCSSAYGFVYQVNHSVDIRSGAQERPEAWDAWCGAACYQHLHAYGLEMSAGDPAYITIRTGTAIAARAIGFFQKLGPLRPVFVPAGLAVAPGQELQGLWEALARHVHAGYLRPLIIGGPPDMPGHRPAMTGGCDAVWSLKGDEATCIASLKQKWRNRLNRARRVGLDLRSGTAQGADHHWIVEETHALARSRRFRAPPPDLAARMAAHRGKSQLLWVTARADHALVAGAIFLVGAGTAHYMAGVSTPAGRAHCAQHGVLGHAANLLRQHGVERLNLGLVDTHSHPGLARFKLGTGAQIVYRPAPYFITGID